LTQNPQHFFMVTATVFYSHEDRIKTFPLNSVFTTPSKKIKAHMIQGLQERMLSETADMLEVPKANMLRIVFSGFSYLGLMSPKEFSESEKHLATAH
jgi:hypothetical protein